MGPWARSPIAVRPIPSPMAWGKGLSFLYGPLRGRATLTQVLRYGGNRRWPASYLPLTLSFSEGKCSSKLKKIELFLKLIFVGVDLPGCISFCCAAVSQLYTYTYPLFGFPFHSEFHVLYNGSHQLSILYIVSTVYIHINPNGSIHPPTPLRTERWHHLWAWHHLLLWCPGFTFTPDTSF